MQIYYFIQIILLCLAITSNAVAYSYGDPSAEEQAHLEAINLARTDPVAEAQRLGLSSVLEGITDTSVTTNSLPPLTMNENLSLAAKSHSQLMATTECFSHICTGENDVGQRITLVNYDWQTYGENIAFTASTATLDSVESSLKLHDLLFIDEGYPGRGHRVNILNPKFKEIGISLASGTYQNGIFNAYYVTTDFGAQLTDTRSFLLGVAYNDQTVVDGKYSVGEGLSGISIEVVETGDKTTTASAGGYAIPLSDGVYTIRFINSSNQAVDSSVTIQGKNVKLDIKQSDFSSLAQTNTSIPTSASEVVTSPSEGNSNHTNYFFLEINTTFTHDISVDYSTRDVSASAPSDYISASGTATIKAGSLSTVIPIEIVADSIAESTETFELVLTNPQGANFPTGVSEITAQRVILDDD